MNRQSVLVVEDDQDIVEELSDLLTDSFDVRSVEYVDDAFSELSEHQFDFVILDMELPWRDNHLDGTAGITILDFMQNEKNTPRVIVLTQYDDPDIKNACAGQGVKAFLTKSSGYAPLVAALKEPDRFSN